MIRILIKVGIVLLSFFYGTVLWADADMFRMIEQFEENEIDRKSARNPLQRNIKIYGTGSPYCLQNSTCRQWSCREIAQKLKEPAKNGPPVVSEDDY